MEANAFFFAGAGLAPSWPSLEFGGANKGTCLTMEPTVPGPILSQHL